MQLEVLFSRINTALSFSPEIWMSLLLGAIVTAVIAYVIYRIQKKETSLHKQDHDAKFDKLEQLHRRDSEKIELLYKLIIQTQNISVSSPEAAALETQIKEEAAAITENDSLQARTLKAIAEHQDDDAQRLLNEIAARESDLEQLYQLRLLFERRAGNFYEAIKWSRKLSERNPGNPEHALTLIHSLLDAGNYDEARKIAGEFIAQLRQSGRESDPSLPQLLNYYGYTLYKEARFAEAEPYIKQAYEIAASLYEPNNPQLNWFLFTLGENYANLARYKEAEAAFQQAISITREDSEDNELTNAETYRCLAQVYCALDRYKEAEELLFKSINTQKKYLNPDHPDLSSSYNSLGCIFYQQDNLAEAEKYLKLSYNSDLKSLGESHPNTMACLNNIAVICGQQGKFEEAISMLNKVLAFNEQKYGISSELSLSTLHNLAFYNGSAGRIGEAEDLYKRAWAISAEINREESQPTVSILTGYAGLLVNNKRFGEAEPLAIKALQIARKIHGNSNSETIYSVRFLANLYYLNGRFADAEPLYQECLAAYQADAIYKDSLHGLLERYSDVLFQLGRQAEADSYKARADELKERLETESNPPQA